MKNNKLESILDDIKKINLSGKAGYCLAKNRQLIEKELEAINETIKPLPEYVEYEKERIELAKTHAKKDDKGKELTENVVQNGRVTEQYILKDEKKFEEDFKNLQIKHKVAIEKREKQIGEYNKLMEEDINFEFFKIDEKDIPEQATSDEVYTLLRFIK